jgi:hypothetical protein
MYFLEGVFIIKLYMSYRGANHVTSRMTNTKMIPADSSLQSPAPYGNATMGQWDNGDRGQSDNGHTDNGQWDNMTKDYGTANNATMGHSGA